MKARRFNCMPVLAILFALASLVSAPITAHASTEDALKAAFVYNFAKLVDWPSDTGSFTVGIVGSSPAGTMIQAMLSGKTVHGHPVVVKSGSGGCQIVFVCGSGGPEGSGPGVLTIGESPGFAGNGGCIGFVIDDGKVHFEINMGSCSKAHLKVDAKLTQLGKVVG